MGSFLWFKPDLIVRSGHDGILSAFDELLAIRHEPTHPIHFELEALN
jgi:hypothetical protein